MSNSQDLHKSSTSPDEGAELSLKDVVDFLHGAWKTVVITTVIGLIWAIVYLVITPKQYEAVAHIKMAQISLINPANPFGTPVEDPVSLIARMQMPTNYDTGVVDACNYQDLPQAATQLSKALKLTAPKGLTNTVELKVLAKSPEIAKSCAQAVVDKIAQLQMQFAKPFVEEAKLKLAQDNDRIEAARKLIAKADQSGSAMSAAYLSARDEITYFLTDREKMLDLINSAQQRGTKLISPIYASENPVLPKKVPHLVAGLCAGLFMGLAIALSRRVLGSAKRKDKMGGYHA